MRRIAGLLGRSPNTISAELMRNQVTGSYDAKKARHKAYIRRKYAKYQGMKIVEHDALQREISARLYDDQSPETIAGYIRRNRFLSSISKDSICRFVASVYGRRIEYYRLRKRARRRSRRPKAGELTNRTFIDKRPKNISVRKYVGGAEADFIVSGKSGKGMLLAVGDRKSRSIFLELLIYPAIQNVHAAFIRIKTRFRELKALTMDNDILFEKHEELVCMLKVKICFCHPYRNWEKGTAENANKAIRRDVPKGSDLSRYTTRFIEALERKLNRRPMKCLGYQSPQEVLDAHRRRRIKKNTLARGVLIEAVG